MFYKNIDDGDEKRKTLRLEKLCLTLVFLFAKNEKKKRKEKFPS